MNTDTPPVAPLGNGLRLDPTGVLPCLRFSMLASVPGFRHAITTRLGGGSAGSFAACNLGLSAGDDRATVLANRASAAALVTDGGGQPATVRQVHGVAAIRLDVQSIAPGEPLGAADMIATMRTGVALLVQAADCAPVVVLDPVRHAAAAVHAGWRGTAAAAGREAVATMARLFGSRPDDLLVGIGPTIGVCCYEMGDEVAAAVDRAAGAVMSRPGPRGLLHTDIAAALRRQLVAAGVRDNLIAVAGLCTACRTDLLYSHRREGEPTGRFGALVAIV